MFNSKTKFWAFWWIINHMRNEILIMLTTGQWKTVNKRDKQTNNSYRLGLERTNNGWIFNNSKEELKCLIQLSNRISKDQKANQIHMYLSHFISPNQRNCISINKVHIRSIFTLSKTQNRDKNKQIILYFHKGADSNPGIRLPRENPRLSRNIKFK